LKNKVVIEQEKKLSELSCQYNSSLSSKKIEILLDIINGKTY
jgi:hypothetical protein